MSKKTVRNNQSTSRSNPNSSGSGRSGQTRKSSASQKKRPPTASKSTKATRSTKTTKSAKTTRSTKNKPAPQNPRPKTASTARRTSSQPALRNSRRKKAKRQLRVGRVLTLLVLGAILAGGVGYAGLKYGPSLFAIIPQLTNNEKTAPLNRISHANEVKKIKEANALDEVSVTGFSDEELRDCFFSQSIDDKLKERLVKMGYADQIPADQLSYVRVLYNDFNGRATVGEIVVNSAIAKQIENVFYDLFLHKYQIGKMILPDAYGTRISESYADNNTVGLAFNLTDDNGGSLHARGYAVDLNPLYNPLIKDNGSSLSVFPMEGQLYLDRTINADHYIHANDYAVEAFKKEGFSWKGNVTGLNDYKHFEYSGVPAASSTTNTQTSQSSSASSQKDSTGQTPSTQTVSEPVQEPVVTPDQNVTTPDQSGVDQPAIDQPVVDQPAIDQPAVDQPVVNQPVVDQPVADQPGDDLPGEIIINPDGTMNGESPMPVEPDVVYPEEDGGF